MCAVINLALAQITAGSGLSFGGASGTTLNVNTAGSLTVSSAISTNSLQLVNDATSPGNDYFYGTNGSGNKGWYALGSFGATSATGTVGQVLVNNTSGTAQTGALTLTLASGLTGINSITSAASTALTLATGTYGTAISIASATGLITLPAYSTAGILVNAITTGAVSSTVTPSGLTSIGVNTVTSASGTVLALATGTYGTAISIASSTGIPTFEANEILMSGGSSIIDNGSGGATVAAGGTNQTLALNGSGTGGVTSTLTSVGTGSTAGFTLKNTTLATSGAQQYSPEWVLQGQGWAPGLGTPASVPVGWVLQVQPNSYGSGSGSLVIGSVVNGGAFQNNLTLNSNGNVTAYGNLSAGELLNTPVSGSTGSFTTLAASSTVSGTGFSTYLASPPAIGGTAAAAGTFTTLTTTTSNAVNVIGGSVQITGAATPSSGAGLEIQYSGGASTLTSYNRTGASYEAMNLSGSTINIFSQASAGISVTGTGSTGITFTAYGSGAITSTSGVLSATSDARTKNIHGLFTRGLAEIEKINPVLYDHKWDKNHLVQAGFTTQDVEPIIPEAVHHDSPDGMATFSDRPIIAALVNAVKELNTINKTLQDKIAKLEFKQ